MPETTREVAANQRDPLKAGLPALPTNQVVTDLMIAFTGPSAHLHDDVRRVVEAALVHVRSEGFRDGAHHVRTEVKRALGIHLL